MNDLLIGTSGYDYPEWKGVFYPPEVKRADFLSYYSTQFNALELNNTFYNMPVAEKMANFVNRSQEKINFSVKANRLLTHEIDHNWKSAATDFKTALKPIAEKNLLSAVLFQFPQSFHYIPENRFYLADLIQTFDGFPVVIEFRHKEWIKESVFEGLIKRNASITFCDMPELKALPQMSFENSIYSKMIGPQAYIRLHGRNANAWYVNDSTNNGSARYDYSYTDEELRTFVPIIHMIKNADKRVQVFFNNHPKGQGVNNAKSLKAMMNIDFNSQ